MAQLENDDLKTLAENVYKQNIEISAKNKIFSILGKLYEIGILTLTPKELAEKITQTIQTELIFEIVEVFLFEQGKDLLKPIAFASSERLSGVQAEFKIFFGKTVVPLAQNSFFENVVRNKRMGYTEKFVEVWGALIPQKMIAGVQSGDHIKCSLAYPLVSGFKTIGVLFFSLNRLYEQLLDYEKKSIESIINVVAVALNKALLDEELKIANAKLEQLDHAKSDFISIASHQLRTPLTVIKGYISMIQEGSFGKVPDKIGENLSKVFISNERLISLVEDLLNISRIESGRQQFNWTTFDFVELAKTLAENLTQNAKNKGLKLSFVKPKTTVPVIVAEHNKIQDVMINFIDNAIKYTAKGKVEVSVEAKPTGMLTFCVKDTGRGIDTITRDALFQKFSRGQGSFQINTGGSGLGLYVAKMIVEAHEGKIWVESAGVDQGSAFCFAIPIAGPKNKSDIPFSQPGQKVDNPVSSTPPAIPALTVMKK